MWIKGLQSAYRPSTTKSFSISVKLLQAGTRGHRSGYQHESRCTLGQCALRCDWPSQVAVWCVVTWRHSGQSHGVRRPCRVGGATYLPWNIKNAHISSYYMVHDNKCYFIICLQSLFYKGKYFWRVPSCFGIKMKGFIYKTSTTKYFNHIDESKIIIAMND